MDLTASQHLMWLGQRLNPVSPLYNMAFGFHIFGPIDPARFAQAFAHLVTRRDALRLVLDDDGGSVKQRISNEIDSELDILDFSQNFKPVEHFSRWAQGRTELPFNLERQMFYSALVCLGEEHYVWYFNQHHLITDAWSCEIMFNEMSDIYEASFEADTAPRFVAYVEEYARSRKLEQKTLDFWSTKPSAKPLSFYGRPVERLNEGSIRHALSLDTSIVERLRQLTAGASALTPEIGFFCGLATLISTFVSRVTSEQEVLLGVLSHNRSTRERRAAAGMYIETSLLQTSVDSQDGFGAALGRTILAFQETLRHTSPGISAATAASNCQVILNYLPFRFTQFAGMSVTAEWLHPNAADPGHLLRVQVQDFGDTGGLTLLLDMNESAFGAHEQDLLPDQLAQFVRNWIDEPQTPLGMVPLEDERALHKSIETANRTDQSWQRASLASLLDGLDAASLSNHVAVRDGESGLSYAALRHSTNALATQLMDAGVSASSIVAVFAKPTLESVVAILATLKAGAAFAALDPAHPVERNTGILNEIANAQPNGPVVLLTCLPDAIDAPQARFQRISVNVDDLIAMERRPLPWNRSEQDLCYVLYTSGSTGAPKGTLVPDRGLINYLNWAGSYYAADTAVSMPLFTSLSFDLTLTSLFLPLVTGGTVEIYQDDPLRALPKILEEGKVDIVKLTPSHLALLNKFDPASDRLKALILGGEILERAIAQRIRNAWGSGVSIYNEYGPTETVIGCMVHRYQEDVDKEDAVPIGQPISNMQVYVLDENQKPVARGVVGELCIGGSGVSSGYLNQPSLTQSRFVPNPFKAGTRLYRSGDLARLRGNQVEFLGRADRQVKLHGHRIELDEISAVLSQYPSINSAAVNLTKLRSTESFCQRCGISSNYPDSNFDADGVCAACREFHKIKDKLFDYFGDRSDLIEIVERLKTKQTSNYTCIALLSGGKDSTYMLYQLVSLDVDVLAVTLDNGFISDGAKQNIKRVTDTLNVDHLYVTTEHMNEIFSDSLARHSNVCNGCFKTIYTLSMNIAKERGIPGIVTGLARGQLFETRLVDMCYTGEFDPVRIDETVKSARKAYHEIPDAATRLLPTKILEDDGIYDELEFVDFYRYCDVALSDMYAFLDQHAPWIRPQDTGRSTNCTVNDTGIHVHQLERGYHNYALPYSWDVRLGHKTREAAMYELDDRIDLAEVQSNLDKIGYQPRIRKAEQSLAAFFTADTVVDARAVKDFLGNRLPQHMLPTHFVQLDALPLTSNGKVDFGALPNITQGLSRDVTPPKNAAEALLAEVWLDQFDMQVGTLDDFFELGGDSVIAVQIIDALEAQGYQVEPRDIFECPTIQELAPRLVSMATPSQATKAFDMVSLDDAAKQTIAAALKPKNNRPR